MTALVSVPRAVLLVAMAGVMALVLWACSADGDGGESVAADMTTEDGAATDTPDEAAHTDDSAAEDSDNKGSAGMPDVCALLSPAQIESATGFAVDESVGDPDRQTKRSVLCEWTSMGDSGFVAMAIAPGSSIPYEEGESAAGTAVAVDIPGASEAYTLRDGNR